MDARMDIHDDIEELSALGGLYGLLGRLLEGELDPDLLALLRGPLAEPLATAGVELPEDVATGDADAVLATLAEEFAALFVVPGAISPYASVFETGAMFQEPCDRVARAYQEAGYAFRNVHSGEFPDHVGVMLAFVGRLYEREAEARRTGDAEAAEDLRVRRERFLIEELGGWAPGWCRTARAAAEHPFYQRVLTLVEQVLWEDLARITPARRLRELAARNQREPARLDYNADYRKASGL